MICLREASARVSRVSHLHELSARVGRVSRPRESAARVGSMSRPRESAFFWTLCGLGRAVGELDFLQKVFLDDVASSNRANARIFFYFSKVAPNVIV